MNIERMLIDTLDRADDIKEGANGERPRTEDLAPEDPMADPEEGNEEDQLPPASPREDAGTSAMEVDGSDSLETPPVSQESTSDLESSDDEDVSWGDNDYGEDDAIQALEEAAATPLFAGSEHSSMGATYILLSAGKLHKCMDTYLDELFRALSMTILPTPNSLPASYREASEYLKRLGHSYKSFDVCPKNCVLFRGATATDVMCPNCRSPRRKPVGKSQVPQKVARYFPVTRRLERMFKSPEQACAMTWWASQHFDGNVMKHVSQSRQWQFIDERFRREFGYNDRNVRVALVADGINPNGDKRSVYSLWLVMLLNYNIPPWLSTKRYFTMLAILIPGPKSVTSEHFDVFLEPLIEEMLDLWNYGVYRIDAACYKESSHFILRAMLIWTIGDFLAYGMLGGCVTKGFVDAVSAAKV